ncbi:MAG TPA: FGGY family carbohydrate kinase, partial [Kofleriaceae bacterium]|nr:FGGY family carbohydrate kinase [Kofleriaceae bacterium]
MRHVIAIDQGTTGSTVLILDDKLAVRGRGYQEFPQIYPKPGWVEHDATEVWRRTREVIGGAMASSDAEAGDVAAIGITNQRETT